MTRRRRSRRMASTMRSAAYSGVRIGRSSRKRVFTPSSRRAPGGGEFRTRPFERRRLDVPQDHARALGRDLLSEKPADAARGTGDEDVLAGVVTHGSAAAIGIDPGPARIGCLSTGGTVVN